MDTPNYSTTPVFGNNPPQIFGNFTTDGSALTPALSQDFFPDPSAPFGYDDHQDSSDPKRRRIARACDACRRKKIKCDGRHPLCSHCIAAKSQCIYTHVEKKRNPPKGAKYIEGLENRLERMEHLLRMSGILNQGEETSTDLGEIEQRLAQKAPSPSALSDQSSSVKPHIDSANQSPRRDQRETPRSTLPTANHLEDEKEENPKSDVEELSDMFCSLVTNSNGETRYIGSSSSFSIFSPKGIQWVNEKTGDNSFQNLLNEASAQDNKWYHWRPEIFGDIFARRVFKTLPPKEECMSLLKDYFESFNMIFPLFHEPTFMWLVEKQYSKEPYDGSGWWASLNVALAISYRIRVMKNLVPGADEAKGWAYFKNALAVESELTLRNTDLLSVQALLGMCLFLQGTPNPQPSFFLVAAAIRLAHSIGLHKRGTLFGMNPAETEQRKRVFWIAYMIDRDVCLRSGRPPAQDDDDWNVELPSEAPSDGVGVVPLANGVDTTNLFRLMCTFSVISSKIYKRLYSGSASKQSDGMLLNTIGDLDNELELWKDNIPIDFRPEHEIRSSNESLILQVVVLHFAYYNAVCTIHRMAIHHGYWTSRLSEYARKGLNVKPLNPRVFSSAALCVSAARASVNLIKYIPQGDYACVWLIIYYPVSSLVTLFANILQNPQDARARSDHKLMGVVVHFLSRICLEETTGSIKHMYLVCKEFERIAGVVLNKAEKDLTARQKRKAEREREKAEKKADEEQNLPPELKRTSDAMEEMIGSYVTPSPQSRNVFTSEGIFQDEKMNERRFDDLMNQVFDPSNGQDNVQNRNPWYGGDGPQNNGDIINNPLQPMSQDTSPRMAYTNVPNDGTQLDSSLNLSGGAFQQPFVPQDLWAMPMTFEWDWADSLAGMSNGAQFGWPQN